MLHLIAWAGVITTWAGTGIVYLSLIVYPAKLER